MECPQCHSQDIWIPLGHSYKPYVQCNVCGEWFNPDNPDDHHRGTPKGACSVCQMRWGRIRKKEDEVYRMKKTPKVYAKTIPILEAELKHDYERVRKCRETRHKDVQY